MVDVEPTTVLPYLRWKIFAAGGRLKEAAERYGVTNSSERVKGTAASSKTVRIVKSVQG
jgi:hypothetical protein